MSSVLAISWMVTCAASSAGAFTRVTILSLFNTLGVFTVEFPQDRYSILRYTTARYGAEAEHAICRSAVRLGADFFSTKLSVT